MYPAVIAGLKRRECVSVDCSFLCISGLNHFRFLHLFVASQGKYEEAEALYERCLAIREKAEGVEHPGGTKALKSRSVQEQVTIFWNVITMLYVGWRDSAEVILSRCTL